MLCYHLCIVFVMAWTTLIRHGNMTLSILTLSILASATYDMKLGWSVTILIQFCQFLLSDGRWTFFLNRVMLSLSCSLFALMGHQDRHPLLSNPIEKTVFLQQKQNACQILCVCQMGDSDTWLNLNFSEFCCMEKVTYICGIMKVDW